MDVTSLVLGQGRRRGARNLRWVRMALSLGGHEIKALLHSGASELALMPVFLGRYRT